MVEDKKTTDLPAVRESERPKDSASSWQIPMILKALVSTMSSSATSEAGAPPHWGEQYSIRLWIKKSLYMVRRSGVPRKDFA